jgi:hypothetical protein
MYPITAEFRRFEDVSFGYVLRGVGVYVIWDSQARARPSYIGKGDILSRISSHHKKFAFPVKGYIALVGNSGKKSENRDALIVEALLLEVARHTDRWPPHNKNAGNISLLQRVCNRHGLIRVTIKSCDLFGPPHAPRRLKEPKKIWFSFDRDGEVVLRGDWNYRKRLL